MFGLEYKLIAGAALIAALFGWHELQVHEAATAATKACQDSYQAAAFKATTEARAEEQRRTTAQGAVNDETQRLSNLARAHALGAAAAADRLQQRTAAFVSSTASHPAIGSGLTSTPDSGGMLADVQRRLAAAAGLYADIADQRGTAGQGCVGSYDALTKP